ncbi:ATP-binding cassette domain-containing protein [Streptomyces sp. NPDC055092]
MSGTDEKRTDVGPQGASGGDGLSVTSLSVAYGTAQVLHEVSFDVAPGEVLGIVGESGCGKSTLAYALGRHLAPGARVLGGSVRVDGADVLALRGRSLRDWRAQQLAVVHQDAAGALDPTMRIGAQLGEVLRERGLSRAATAERVVGLLRRVRLPASTPCATASSTASSYARATPSVSPRNSLGPAHPLPNPATRHG